MIIKRLRQILIAALVTYLGYMTSVIIWQYYTPVSEQVDTAISTQASSNNQLPKGLFGVEAKAPAPKPTYQKVKKTNLDVTLIGIIKKSTPLAIIKFANKQVEIYGINDSIRGIAVVKAIENDFVIINYNGKDEKLVIERPIDPAILGKLVDASNKKIQVSPKSKPTPEPSAPKPVAISNSEKQTLKRYLQRARINPMSLLGVIRVEPFFSNGALIGFKVFPGREVALFNTIGLKSGDIVTEINGVKLDKLSSAIKIGKDLAKETEFNVSIERNGQMQNIYFSLN